MHIGVDIVRVSQIAHSLSVSDGLVASVFGPSERALAESMPLTRAQEFLAGRFAVKEAALKAMHVPYIDTVALYDIETTTNKGGYPELHLHASALRASRLLNISSWQVSISHEDGLAVAFVVAY